MQSGKCSILSLVVVAGIVVVVAIILFPIFASTRERPGKSKCLNNLKGCALALKLYADDYNGMLPSSYMVSRSKQWNPIDSYAFVSRPGKLPPDEGARLHTWSQVLYSNMRSKDIMWCPSDPADKTDPDAQTSYWYKIANDKAWYGIGCPKPRRNMNDYAWESDQIAFYERLGWHFGDQTGLHNNGQINAAFMDTHVETITITNATSGDPTNCAANSDGEPMYYNTSVDGKKTKTQTGPATLTDPANCYDTL